MQEIQQVRILNDGGAGACDISPEDIFHHHLYPPKSTDLLIKDDINIPYPKNSHHEKLKQVAVSSHYWKIPDKRQYLSAIETHETDPLIAIASGSKDSNLFIYELGYNDIEPRKSILTHHQTITLGGIHSLAWASPHDALGSQGNIIFTGHNSGMVHMILLSDPYNSNDPAEILKRFNHNKHVKDATSTRINYLSLTSNNWTCCASSSIMTLFNEHLFLWDPSRSDVPIMKKKSKGICCFDISNFHDGIISVGSVKGISIRDIRDKGNSGLFPPVGNNTKVSRVKWSPFNENLVASVHDGNVIKVWDIRSTSPMLLLDGHSDVINDIHWSNTNTDKLWSASNDSTLRMWDIHQCREDEQNREKNNIHKDELNDSTDSLTTPANSINSTTTINQKQRDVNWVPTKPWKLYRQRLSRYDESFSLGYFMDPIQNGPSSSTTVFSESKQFLTLAAFNKGDPGVLSIDNDGFFGLHVGEGLLSRRGSRYSGYSDSLDTSDDHSSDDGRFYSPPR